MCQTLPHTGTYKTIALRPLSHSCAMHVWAVLVMGAYDMHELTWKCAPQQRQTDAECLDCAGMVIRGLAGCRMEHLLLQRQPGLHASAQD